MPSLITKYRGGQVPVHRTTVFTIEIFKGRSGTPHLKLIPGERAAVASYVKPIFVKDINRRKSPKRDDVISCRPGIRAFAALYSLNDAYRSFLVFVFMVIYPFIFVRQARRFLESSIVTECVTSNNRRGGERLRDNRKTAAAFIFTVFRLLAVLSTIEGTTHKINTVFTGVDSVQKKTLKRFASKWLIFLEVCANNVIAVVAMRQCFASLLLHLKLQVNIIAAGFHGPGVVPPCQPAATFSLSQIKKIRTNRI